MSDCEAEAVTGAVPAAINYTFHDKIANATNPFVFSLKDFGVRISDKRERATETETQRKRERSLTVLLKSLSMQPLQIWLSRKSKDFKTCIKSSLFVSHTRKKKLDPNFYSLLIEHTENLKSFVYEGIPHAFPKYLFMYALYKLLSKSEGKGQSEMKM